jgi:dUTP pyrophosphatase
MKIRFLLGDNASMPTHNGRDAGYDLYASREVIIKSLDRALVSTGVSWEVEFEKNEPFYFGDNGFGIYCDIRDRSGNALKKGLTVLGGIVDEEYRGIIGVILYNTSKEDVIIKIGDKIAQAIFTPCFLPVLDETFELSETERGSNGFGSSGVAGT